MADTSREFDTKMRRKRYAEIIDDGKYLANNYMLSNERVFQVMLIADLREILEKLSKLQNSVNGTT